MQNKQEPTTFIHSLDFLQIISNACQEYGKDSNFDDFYAYLRENIFCKLGQVSVEIYFSNKEHTIYRPLVSGSGRAKGEATPDVPTSIDMGAPLLADLLERGCCTISADSPQPPPFVLESDNLCHALLPLSQDADLTSILYIGCRQSSAFPHEYLLGLKALAGMINSRMASMNVIADLNRSMTSLENSERLGQALYEINEQAHLVRTEEELFASLHHIVGRFINARNFFVALSEVRQGEQYIKFSYYCDQWDSHFQGVEFRVDPQHKPSMTGYLLKSGKPVLLRPDSFDRFCEENGISPLGSKASSLIGVPFYLEQSAGVVLVQSYGEIVYTEKDKDLLVYVARHIGDAIGRKKILDDMRDANEVFSLFLRYSPVNVFIKEVTASESRILQASENFKNMLSKSGTAIIGKTMSELFSADIAKKMVADDWQVVSNGTALQVEEHLERQTYTTIKFPITKGGRTLLAGYSINISERTAMEEALRESERRYRIIFEKSPLGVIRFDCEGTMLDFNAKFIEIMGSSREKLLGFNSARQSTPRVRESLKKALGGEISSFEEDYTSVTGGKTSYIRGIFNPINPGHNPTDVIATIEDITELKNHEREQHKIEKLESLGILAGGIAHDFNNILTGITANISFAQVLLDGEHPSAKPLTEAAKAARRAAELARQLLTFAKGGEPNKKIISLQYIIEEAVSLMLRGSNVRAIVDINKGIHAIQGDEGQISQVLNNLIINAAQAMPDGGTLTIHAENIHINQATLLGPAAGNYVKITITDEGCGISPEHREKIFDPYFTTKKEGTGLGLASAYSIIHRHQGYITVDSTVGKGTVFTIFCPSVGTSYNDHPATSSPRSGFHTGGPILVMDDEEMIRSLARTMLTHLGYQVTTCASGEEAIQLYAHSMASNSPFKAVIMDLTIPGGIGGKKTAEEILQRFPSACLIVSSGYSNDPIMARYRDYGFFGTIAKPYSLSEFEQVLGSLPDV